MDKGTLVDLDFRTGERIVSALEKSGLPLTVALWARFPEYQDWRFVFASRALDSLSQGDAYLKANRVLDEAGITVWETPAIIIMKTTDPFIRALRKGFGRAKTVSGMRFGGQEWGGRVVEDAVAYKIA